MSFPSCHAVLRRALRQVLVPAAFLLFLTVHSAWAQVKDAGFELVALGVNGGLEDGNLTSYLLRVRGDTRYLVLDAGSVLPGIASALAKGGFADAGPAGADSARGHVFHDLIAGYFISHAHLDHVQGLLIAATDDTGHKPIYGLASTLDALSRDYFNWSAWPNFADRGAAPALGRYRLTEVVPGQWFDIPGTALSACVYPLSHDKLTSSMILLRAGQAYYAFFGDTGPDALSAGQHRLADIWQVLAPLVRRHQLKGLQIEASLPNDVADAQLFGHLTPAWLMKELGALAVAAGGERPLQGLPIVVDHIKPSLVAGRDPRSLIGQQLAADNLLGVRFLFPEQGDTLELP